ncbi:MAG TPA: hypothetical protein IAD07_09040 [Candidatus Fimivicinus intestinavium]|nr:hypothetical protein [Candidatus Fimivicinus intestinavium]
MERINTNHLKKYRKTMIFRGILLWIPSILSAVSMLLFRFAWSPFFQRPLSDFGSGFQAGMVLSLLVLSLVSFISTIRTCRNPEKLKKAYVEEMDERTQLISRKAFSAVGWAFFLVLPPALLTAMFFSSTVGLTLLAVLLFFLAVLLVSLVYHRRRL